MGKAKTALLGLLADMIGDDQTLNDPHADDSGTDAQSPDGDNYNVLFDHVLNACNAAGINTDKEIERIKRVWREHKAKANKGKHTDDT